MNLAGAFVLKEHKVLAIDLDPQCNASIAFNIIVDANSPGIRHLLMGDRFSLSQCLYDRGPYCDFAQCLAVCRRLPWSSHWPTAPWLALLARARSSPAYPLLSACAPAVR